MKKIFLFRATGRILANFFGFVWKVLKSILNLIADLAQLGLCLIIGVIFIFISFFCGKNKVKNRPNGVEIGGKR